MSEPRVVDSSLRERLLDAAERVFAERGFAAASVREITSEAEANLAAVNYHFGGKENLYREVVERRFREMRERRLAAVAAAREGASGGRGVEEILRAYSTAVLEPTPEPERAGRLMQLFSWSLLEGRLPGDLCRGGLIDPSENALVDALLSAEPSLDPETVRRVVRDLGGILWANFQAAHAFPEARLVPGPGEERAAWLDHLVHFVAAGLRACSEERSR